MAFKAKGSVHITDPEAALYISEYSRRKSLSDIGVMTSESEYSEIFLEAFVIIDQEINRLQNEKMKKNARKKGR